MAARDQPFVFLWLIGALILGGIGWNQAEQAGFYAAHDLDAASRTKLVAALLLFVAGFCAFMFGRAVGIFQGRAGTMGPMAN